MKSKQGKFLVVIVATIVLVIGVGIISDKAQKPGKLDDFAKALKEGGAEFYGAFWCQHCQAQKAEFGTSKKYLPYIECSNPNQSVTQICKEKKIESYPTWIFKNGIIVNSPSLPIVCKVNATEGVIADEPPQCTPQVTSQYYKTWIFPGYKFTIKSSIDPIATDSLWKFAPESETTGELPLDFLANQVEYTLPK